MRINQYLAHKGYCSRREADKLIAAGKIIINGKEAMLGAQVNEGDVVEVAGEIEMKKQERRFFAYHKAAGEMDLHRELVSLDRLDKKTAGLMILSDDKNASDLLLNPRSDLSQEFIIHVHRALGKEFFGRFEQGFEYNGRMVAAEAVNQIGPRSFSITLINEDARDIRVIAANLGYETLSMTRVALAGIKLNHLDLGKTRSLSAKERGILEKYFS